MNTEKSLLIALRRWIGISITLLVPICLLFGGLGPKWSNEAGIWCQSVSAMYWTSARNAFIGLIFLDSVFFILYKGYDWKDRVVNILTGLCLLGLIIFPSFSPTVLLNNFTTSFEVFPYIPNSICDKLHRICAMGIFIIQTINLTFLFTKQKGEITEKKKQRNIVYYVCSACAIILLITNEILAGTVSNGRIPAIPFEGLIIEGLAFIVIGVAWLVKGEGLEFLNDK